MAQLNKDMWEKVYRKRPDIVTRKIAGELFLVPIRGRIADMNGLFSLNSVAEFIWENLGDRMLKDISNDIIDRFDVEKEEAETDILEFVRELIAADLIGEAS